MKKRVMIPSLLIGVLLLGGGGLALAGSGYGQGFRGDCSMSGRSPMSDEEHSERMSRRMEQMATILDLTADQQAQISSLMNDHYQANRSLRDQLRQSRETLRDQASGSNFDEQSFRSQAEQQAALKTDLMVSRVKTKQQMFALLTPKQQQKAEALWQRGGKGHHGRHDMDF